MRLAFVYGGPASGNPTISRRVDAAMPALASTINTSEVSDDTAAEQMGAILNAG